MPPITKLTRGHRRLVTWTALALALSGLVWMAGYYGLAAWPDVDGPRAREVLHWIVMAHGVVGYGGAILFGSLLGRHIPAGLQGRFKRVSGIAAIVSVVLLILTALLLYYSGDEDLRQMASLTHQVCGVVAVALITFHISRRVRRIG